MDGFVCLASDVADMYALFAEPREPKKRMFFSEKGQFLDVFPSDNDSLIDFAWECSLVLMQTIETVPFDLVSLFRRNRFVSATIRSFALLENRLSQHGDKLGDILRCEAVEKLLGKDLVEKEKRNVVDI